MSEGWVCIHVASNRGEAELLAGILRAEGITAQIRGSDIATEGPFFPELLVRESEGARARSLLDGASQAATSVPGDRTKATRGGARFAWFLGGAATGFFLALLLSTGLEQRARRQRTEGTMTARDLDGDGKPDEWSFTKGGQVVERRWSLRRDGVVDKKAFYRFGVKAEERFDLDRDGVFETTKEYDAFEQPKRAAP